MRTLVIGDIHSCHAELLELLERAGLAADDAIVSLDDLVDRGPATPAVLRFFQTSPQARALMGNHERKHARSWRGEVAASLAQRISRLQIGEADYPAACAWMDARPRYLALAQAVLVHGLSSPACRSSSSTKR